MPSFDVVSEIDLQEIDNAVNMAMKEIQTRYDFRGSKSTIELDKSNNLIEINADDDYKMGACWDILGSKVVKRGINLKALSPGKIEDATGASKRRKISLVMGIEKDKAKEIVKFIKNSKLKVQPQLQDDKVRVTGKKRDDLQDVISILKSEDFGIPLQFNNFRD